MATKPWRAAKSLTKLKAQVDAAWPNRSKASDGTIGDAAHAATKSEHNPDANGVVRAMDITHDPAHGVDGNLLSTALVASRDTRILYVIWNRRICSSAVQPWKWRTYNGSNPHDHHMHVSVVEDPALYDSQRAWSIGASAAPSPVPAPAPPPQPDDPGADAEPDTFWSLLRALLRHIFKGKQHGSP